MARIACLFAPSFPLAARLRSEPELAGRALVICHGNGNSARVDSLSRAAWAFGIRPGMSLARARSRLPDLMARSHDPVSERAAHEVLLETASTLSPRIEDTSEDTVFADVSGMEKLFPGNEGEMDMARLAVLYAEKLSLMIQIGIASAKLPAKIAARRRESPMVIPPGKEAEFLSSTALESLGLSEKLLRTLHRWGLKTLGDFASLPADRVGARLGPEGRLAQQRARGEDPRPISPTPLPDILSEGTELEWAIVTIEALQGALRPCLEDLHRRLVQRDLLCQTLELELGLEPEGIDRRVIRFPVPARDVEALLGLIGLQLEAQAPPAPVFSFRCIVHPAQAESTQLSLFGPPQIHPDRLALTLARLSARLGPERVGSPGMVDSHLPESFESRDFNPSSTLSPHPPRSRGLLAVRVLRPPTPLEVIVEERQGTTRSATGSQRPARPVSLQSLPGAVPQLQGLVRVASGPWELEDGWWKEKVIQRQYWDVEISGGGLYRVYRDCCSGEWYADGVYD